MRGPAIRALMGEAHRGVAAITSSTAIGQLVALAATPFLTRLYTPQDFGVFAVLMSMVAIAATVGTLRLELAIPVAEPNEARVLLRVSLLTSVLAGVLLLLVALSTQVGRAATAMGGMAAVLLGAAIAYLVWVTAAYAALTNYALRERNYGAVARRNLLQSLGTAVSQLGLGLWAASFAGLAWGQALGRSIGVFSLMRESRSPTPGPVKGPGVAQVMRDYWRYPALFLPAGIMNILSLQFPLLLVGFAYSAEDAGNLSQAMRFTSVPAALIGAAVSSVVLAEIAQRVREGERDNRRRYLRASKALSPIAFVWALLLLLASPWVLPRLLGPGWAESGLFAAALAPSVGLSVLVSPLTMVLPLYGKAVTQFGLDAARLVLVCVSGAVAWWGGIGPLGAVLAMSLCLSLVYVVTWLLGLRIVSAGSTASSL